jgi:hypothetical protein
MMLVPVALTRETTSSEGSEPPERLPSIVASRSLGATMVAGLSSPPPGCSVSGHSDQPSSGALSAPTPSTPATSPAATVPANLRSRTATGRLVRRASRFVFVSDMSDSPSAAAIGKFYGVL